jgi:cation:H+ antiporter
MLEFVFLAASLALLLLAAHYFVQGITAIAEALGAPKIVLGMTVVAFGTSTPELVVNALSAYNGSTALAFGNIVGACLLNVGFVLGLTAMIQPLKVEHSIINREIPMLIVAGITVLVLAADRWLNGAADDSWLRSDGLILLILFCIFLYYTVRQSIGTLSQIEAKQSEAPSSIPIQIAISLAGFTGLSLAANWTVEYASIIARNLGVAENIVGLTIVSMGTTLPELATCILAARRGEADIAIGNIVGSNIFNLLAIGGIVSTIHPVTIPSGGHIDLLVMALLSIILLPIAIRSERTITRGEGAVLLTVFAAHWTWRILGSS